MLRDMLWVSIGAILGANLRYLVYRLGAILHPSAVFPYATLVINLLGSFALALFAFTIAGRAVTDPRWRLLFAVGFCGAFTTFSTFAFDTYTLFASGRPGLFAINVLANNLLCILAVFAAASLSRALEL